MEEHRTRKRYDREFGLDTVRLICKGGQSIAAVARDLGVARTQLERWKREFTEEPEYAFPGKGYTYGVSKELEAMHIELARVKEGREILRKAIGIFSKCPSARP